MSVILFQAPATYSFSGNFIPVRFISDNYLDQVGVFAVNKIAFSGAVAGIAIPITFGTTVVTMTGAAIPDTSGNQFPNGSGDAAYVSTILPYFKANYTLGKNFDIAAVGTELIFTAKTKINGLNFKAAVVGATSCSNSTAGLPDLVKPNYGIYFEVYLENIHHTAYELIYVSRLPLKYGSAGVAEIDLWEILDSALMLAVSNEFETLDPADTDPAALKASCRKYYFRYAESYGNNIEIKKITDSETFTVLLGKLSYQGNYLHQLKNLLQPVAADPAQDRFLIQGNRELLHRANQPLFLQFFNTRTTTNTVLKVKFTFEDLTESIVESSVFSLMSHRKFSFNLRYDQLISRFSLTKKAVRYQVWLQSEATVLSETVTIIVNRTIYQQPRNFLYLSSWGTLNTLFCYGLQSSGISIDQKEAGRMRQEGYRPSHGDGSVYGVSLVNTFKAALGFLRGKDALLQNRDFFSSSKKYRYVAGQILPIKVTSKNINELDDKDNLQVQSFEYEYLFRDDAFTYGDGKEEDPYYIINL